MLNNYALLIDDLLPLAYSSAGDVVIGIFLALGQPVHLLPGQVINLVSSFNRLFCYSLKKIGKFIYFLILFLLLLILFVYIIFKMLFFSFVSGENDGLKFHLLICDYILHFANSQDNLTLEALMKTLFNVIFVDDEWKKLFCSKTQTDLNDFTNETSTDLSMLMIKNRSLSSKHAASMLIHSGVIGRGLRKTMSTDTVDVCII